jgi:hypothetical protein
MSSEAISQPEGRPRTTSKPPAEELSQQLKLLGDLTRLQLATTLNKVFEELALNLFSRNLETNCPFQF